MLNLLIFLGWWTVASIAVGAFWVLWHALLEAVWPLHDDDPADRAAREQTLQAMQDERTRQVLQRRFTVVPRRSGDKAS